MTDEMKNDKLNEKNEIKEEQLEDVAGGAYGDSDDWYSSGDTPYFKKGDWVTIFFKGKVCGYYEGGVILSVNKGKSGLFHREFTYTVKLSFTGKILDNVYESQMLRKEKGQWIPW
ncbi:MAG: hypothetical protein PUC32_01285 [Oscillospiraceae bacterium]|nr:hypothetical protein [Oscillospiraceae bacterium]